MHKTIFNLTIAFQLNLSRKKSLIHPVFYTHRYIYTYYIVFNMYRKIVFILFFSILLQYNICKLYDFIHYMRVQVVLNYVLFLIYFVFLFYICMQLYIIYIYLIILCADIILTHFIYGRWTIILCQLFLFLSFTPVRERLYFYCEL